MKISPVCAVSPISVRCELQIHYIVKSEVLFTNVHMLVLYWIWWICNLSFSIFMCVSHSKGKNKFQRAKNVFEVYSSLYLVNIIFSFAPGEKQKGFWQLYRLWGRWKGKSQRRPIQNFLWQGLCFYCCCFVIEPIPFLSLLLTVLISERHILLCMWCWHTLQGWKAKGWTI